MSRGRWTTGNPACPDRRDRLSSTWLGRWTTGNPACPDRRDRLSSTILLIALLTLAACRQKMAYQPKYDPLEPSDFFADGMSARPRIPGTVARGELAIDGFLATGKLNGQDGDGFPFAVTAEVMNRGEERFNIYCSECHGKAGDGNGMIPSRGYRHPPSFHTDTLRAAK